MTKDRYLGRLHLSVRGSNLRVVSWSQASKQLRQIFHDRNKGSHPRRWVPPPTCQAVPGRPYSWRPAQVFPLPQIQTYACVSSQPQTVEVYAVDLDSTLGTLAVTHQQDTREPLPYQYSSSCSPLGGGSIP